MHTPLVIGIIFAATLACVGLSVFFGRAWWEHREDGEFLIFALLTLSLAAMAAVECFIYWTAIDADAPLSRDTCLRLLVLSGRPILPLLLHFALRYAKIDKAWKYAMPLYLLALPAMVLALTGGWWASVGEWQTIQRQGVELHILPLELSDVAWLAYLQLPVVFAAVPHLLGKSYREGRREGLSAIIGVVALLLAYANDIFIAPSGDTMPLMPAGMLAMAYGVSLALIARYGRLATKLEQRTAQLAQRTRELASAYLQLRFAQEELLRRRQLALVGELAAVVAHEVRNPLAIIGTALTSLGKDCVGTEDRELLLDIVEQEMQRLSRLVDELMDYARPSEPRYEPVNVVELLQRSLALLDKRDDISSDLVFDRSHTELEADDKLLRDAFDNTITNAIQAMPSGGHLQITVEASELAAEPALQISLRDSGEGMTDAQQKQALAPFFTTRPTGTGLGLPIVARIAEAHGGLLTIESEPHAGTCINITLPLRPPESRPAARDPLRDASVGDAPGDNAATPQRLTAGLHPQSLAR